MTDKELIKQEIERRIKETYSTEGAIALESLLDYINSIAEEYASDDLEEEIENYIKDSLAIKFPTIDTEQIKADIRYIARHFAEWQKQQMMKDAVEGEVMYSIGTALEKQYKVTSDRVYIPNVKLGDKVKIIVIKED